MKSEKVAECDAVEEKAYGNSVDALLFCLPNVWPVLCTGFFQEVGVYRQPSFFFKVALNAMYKCPAPESV